MNFLRDLSFANLRKTFSSYNSIFLIIFGILLIVIGYYIYKSKMQRVTEGYSPNDENQLGLGQSSNKDAELMLFYTDWCPHCKTAKPEWQKIKDEYNGKSIKGYNMIFTEIDCTKSNPDVERMMNTYNIKGYPTVKLLKDGQVVEFDSKPTEANLTQFLQSVL
jgi:thiol-disulfide isomerase/thioredoxin